MTKFALAVIAAVVLLAVASSATEAASILWTGLAKNNQWATSENWYPAQVPGAGDDVTIHTGTVIATSPVSINSLLMGDKITGKATLTILSSFTVFKQMECYQNGDLVLSSGASAVSGPVVVQGGLTFSSGSVSGQMTVSGSADLSSAAAKTITGGQLTLSGPSKVGGVISLKGQASLQVSGKSTWSGVNMQAGANDTQASFDATKGTVDISGDISIQATGKFGALTLNSGVNMTLYGNVSFANTLNVPNTSWVSTVGVATTSVLLSGGGNFISGGASTTFGAQKFDGMVACQGQACSFGGKTNSVNNLVVTSGTVSVAQGTAFSAGITSIQNGHFAVAGAASISQLNFLGSGIISGQTKADKLYVDSARAFSLQGGVSVSTAATFKAATLNFGSSGMIHLSKGSNSGITGPFTLQGPPHAAGFSNNGAIQASASVSSQNINVVGTGSWSLTKGSSMKVNGAEIAASTITLVSGASVTGSNTCLNVGAVKAGTVKAKVDSISFECDSACNNIAAACSPMPTNSFSFSG